jgi:histidinol dehydrogenase
MIKILDSKNKNFDKTLDALLSKRKNKVQLNSVSVIKIMKRDLIKIVLLPQV